MGQFKYILSSIWFWLIIVISCFFLENVALLSNGVPLSGFSNSVFYMLTAIIVVMMGVYFFLEHKKNKMKPHWVLFVILTIIFVSLCVAIWTNPESRTFFNHENEIETTLTYSIQEKIHYTIQLFISVVVLYMMLFNYVRGRLRFRKIKWLAYMVIIVVFISCVFSLIFDNAIYRTVFNQNYAGGGVASFFINPNIFALCLLMGIFACLIVNFPKSKWWTYILIFFFIGIMVFTISNACLIISFSVFGLYILGKIIKGFVLKRYFMSWVIVASVLTVGIAAAVLISVAEAKQWASYLSFKNFFLENIFINKFGNFSNRDKIWRLAIELWQENPLRLILGYGYGATSKLILASSSTFIQQVRTCHSGYIEVLLTSGIVGMTLYAIGILYGFYCILRLFIRKQYRFALLYALLYLAILAHNAVESTRFFDISTSGALIMLLVYLPPVAAWRHMKKPQLAKEAVHNYVWQNSVSYISVIRVVTLVLLSLIVGCASAFVTTFPYSFPYVKPIILSLIVFFAANIVFLPYFVALLYKHSSNPRFVVRLLVYGSILLGTLGGSAYLYYLYLPFDFHQALMLGIATYLVIGIIMTIIFRFICFHVRSHMWIRETLRAVFVSPGLAVPVTVVVGGTLTAILNHFIVIDLLTLLTIVGCNILIFYLAFTFGPFKDKKTMAKEFNNEGLFNWRRITFEDKI